MLELPAGKIERSDESPLAAARRELAEEAGKAAAHWEELGSFYLAPGYSDEVRLLRRWRARSKGPQDASTVGVQNAPLPCSRCLSRTA